MSNHITADTCANGHEWTEENTYRPAGRGRSCRACNRDAARRYKGLNPRPRIPAKTAAERFWEKVIKGHGCWEWKGSRRPSGHGQLYWRGRSRPATHAALELAGRQQPEGTEACHRCDNPPCVNPAHLYWGTRQDNIDDAYARGQRAGGERHAAARLTELDVVTLREAFARGVSRHILAERYGIAPGTVNDIAAGRKWPNAAGPTTTHRTTREAA